LVGRAEGGVHSYFGNRYERSRVNRAACLRHFGLRCRGCGDLVEDKYGVLGREVIHVHHIVPISQMGGPSEVNPLTDLIPLCPNCHNVVHREDPPVSIEWLRGQTNYRDR
jgi:5-methylcytosine-specific restriction enzyme A